MSNKNEDEIERISVSKVQLHALNQIRGLSEKAFNLVVCGEKITASGKYYLEGSTDAFDALARDVAEEIYCQLSPPSRLNHLKSLYRKLEPDLCEF